MAERRPALPFRPTPDAHREHELINVPFLGGRWLDITFASGASVATAQHLLGRDYVGGFGIMVMRPGIIGDALDGAVVTSPIVARDNGYDPSTTFVMQRTNAGGLSTQATIRLWVF